MIWVYIITLLVIILILKLHFNIKLEIDDNNSITNTFKIKFAKIKIYNKEKSEKLDTYILNTVLVEKKDVEEGVRINLIFKIIYKNLKKLKTKINVCIYTKNYILNAYLGTIIAIILSMHSSKKNKYNINTKYSKTYFMLDIHIICSILDILKIYAQVKKGEIHGKTSN